METWRIAMPIVIFILCVIIVMYITRLWLQEIRNKTYICPETGYKYMPLYRCRMENPVSGEWLNALIYQGADNSKLYVMKYEDFFDKFVKLTEYNNGNNSKS